MVQQQHYNSGKDNKHDFVFRASSVRLLNDRQWLYVKKKYHMTNRELQVSKLVCRGYNNEDIAVELKITPGTVKTHIRNIYRRVRIKNKIQMVLKFVETATKFAAMSGTTSNIPIIELETSGRKSHASSGIPNKR
jgi:DNA-binding NarL/FixJ family response regulator